MRKIIYIFTVFLMIISCSGVSHKGGGTPSASLPYSGKASWYGDKFNGNSTASGEIFSDRALTAAHPSLPFGSIVEVTNVENNKKIKVRINDRGPFTKGRIIDLSKEAFSRISDVNKGIIDVSIKVVK